MFKKRVEYINILDELYNRIEPNLKTVYNYNPWYIIKIQVGYYLHLIFNGKIKVDNNNEKKLLSVQNVSFKQCARSFLSVIHYRYLITKYRIELGQKLKNKTLYVGYTSHCINQDGNKFYNIYLNPFLEKEGNGVLIFLDKLKDTDIEVLYKYIQRYYEKLNVCRSFFLKRDEYNSVNISNRIAGELQLITKQEFALIPSIVYKNIHENELYYKVFKKWLYILNPELIRTYCCYNNKKTAMVRAANKLGIHLIEYQHSNITDTHFAYSHWKNIDSYSEFLPKYFDVWSLADKNLIENNFKGEKYKPHISITGNVYLNKQKEKYNEVVAIDNAILICLQGQWIPSFIEDFIREDSKYVWYIRLHPRYPEDKKHLDKLHTEFPHKIKYEQANTSDLFLLLSQVQFLLTSFSGTALEAFEFGKQVIIFGEEGLDSYKTYIENGLFKYVVDLKDIEEILYNVN